MIKNAPKSNAPVAENSMKEVERYAAGSITPISTRSLVSHGQTQLRAGHWQPAIRVGGPYPKTNA
jgi:hypothetical protein